MKLIERIQLERLTRAEQLSRAEQAELLANPEAQALLKENAALSGLGWQGYQTAPNREALLTQAMAPATPQEEPKMTMINRMFAGKSLVIRLALGSGLVLALIALTLFGPFGSSPVSTAWAATDGYVLHFDLGPVAPGADADLKAKIDEIQGVLRDFQDARKQEDADAKPLKVAMKVMVEGSAVLEMAIIDDEGAVQASLMEELAAYYAEQPGMPVPTLQPTTWFFDDLANDPFAKDQVTVTLNNRSFSFPASATKAEMEHALNEWLAQEFPDAGMRAEITIETDGGERKIMVKIMNVDCDC